VLPWRLTNLSELRGRLRAYAELGPDQARHVADDITGVENAFKGYSGRRLALVDSQAFARVSAAEADLQARVRRNRAAQRDIGDPWGEIASVQENFRSFYLPYQYLEPQAGGGWRGGPGASDLFAWARDIVRGAEERERADAQRLPKYTNARIGAIEQAVLAERPIDRVLEEVQLSFWLSKLRENLTVDDPLTQRVLGRESPEALAHRLATTSRLDDPAERARLWRGGEAAVAESTDPMIVFVRAWDRDARALAIRYQREVEGPTIRAQERIARVRFQAFGTSVYPDATFTPRLSYGRVAGWSEANGRVVGAFTRFGGLYERATGAEPYRLPPRWVAARPRLDPETTFDVSSTNDIIGGNSGSPLLDRDAHIAGVIFDGNIYSLGGDYFYDGTLNRAVSVTTTALRAALTQVYGLDALVAELDAR
jgi:hypothetical protein